MDFDPQLYHALNDFCNLNNLLFEACENFELFNLSSRNFNILNPLNKAVQTTKSKKRLFFKGNLDKCIFLVFEANVLQ